VPAPGERDDAVGLERRRRGAEDTGR